MTPRTNNHLLNFLLATQTLIAAVVPTDPAALGPEHPGA